VKEVLQNLGSEHFCSEKYKVRVSLCYEKCTYLLHTSVACVQSGVDASRVKASILNYGCSGMEIFIHKGVCWNVGADGMCIDDGAIELLQL